MRKSNRASIAAACLALVLAGGGVAAQEASGERRIARALGEQALALFQEGRWADAYSRFAAADQQLHAPTLVLFMARCKAKLGELVNARGLYERVVREAVAPDAPEQFKSAHEEAVRELAELDVRIPSLAVVVRAAPDVEARIVLDRQPRDRGQLAKGVVVDPGTHELTVSAPGHAEQIRRVQVAERATERVEFELVRADVAEPPAPSRGSFLAPGIVLALGGAALTTGIVTGLVAKGKVDDLRSRCEGNHCPVGDQNEAGTVRTLTTLSTIAFVAGGVGIAAGVVLAIVRPGGEKVAAPTQARLDVRVAPSGLSFSGAF